jgi:NADPH-dependent 2,4-dienoyl-CoA reductase/sulfur reductase-like enzyme/rhodanese-related sulfurtransferase
MRKKNFSLRRKEFVMAQKILVIGAMALGPKAACRFKRLEPDSQVTILDQDDQLFYDRSGLPFYLSGDVSDPEQLQSTSFFMRRDQEFFRGAKGVDVMSNTKALSIDREKKCVHTRNTLSGEENTLSYDKLVLGTGSRPRSPSFPGTHLEGVFTLYHLHDAEAVKERLAKGCVEKAVVVGATTIGLQTAEALTEMWGIETSLVASSAQIMPGLVGKNIARMAQHHMEEQGVHFYLAESVEKLEGDGQVKSVATHQRTLEADLVIMALGVEPNSELAGKAGLDISTGGAVSVNKKMETSDPNIYAGGGCVETTHLVTKRPGHYPFVSASQTQGRVIGTNLAGGHAEYDGTIGSFATKLFDISVGGAGLPLGRALEEGFDAISAMVIQFDRTHYYPEKDLMVLEMVVEKKTGRVLGIQGLGDKGDGMVGRINTVAALLKYDPTLKDIRNLELAYSPTFSSALDILNTAGNVAENVLSGKNRGLDIEAFQELWADRETGKTFFMDCRGWANAEPFVKKYPLHWKNIPQEELKARIQEIPPDRRVVLICNTGMRSYEAQVMLDHAGIRKTYNVTGGMAALKKQGVAV